jgi:hypothetical protein
MEQSRSEEAKVGHTEAELKKDSEATEALGQVEHKHPRETEIIVNGRRRTVPGDEVSFEEVVELAFPVPHTDPNVIYSVTYRHAASHPAAGELAPGGRVKVKNGTIFNVTKTIKS